MECAPVKDAVSLYIIIGELGADVTREEGMATHSNILPGESPWTEEHGRLWSMGSHRVNHD